MRGRVAGKVFVKMIAETVISAGVVAAGSLAFARWRRVKLYGELNRRLARIAAVPSFDPSAAFERSLPGFADRVAIVPQFLPPQALAALKAEAESLIAPERSYIPTHKKGGTIAYETLIENAPAIVSCYHSRKLMELVSRIVGVRVMPTPINDQSSLSLLFYDRPGDHIGWHYDHNFYRGRHFTVLLALDNRGEAEGGLSHAVLKARTGGHELEIATPPNTMVVFEGAAVRHKVTPILNGERRLMLSMTYCTNPGATWRQGVSRRMKDTAFFGLRALWT
jgi:hypothetical protein